MNFFAKRNGYGKPDSVGFSNTWDVLAFSSRESRDAYVKAAYPRNMSVEAIKLNEVTSVLRGSDEGPKPFSGEYWGISTMDNEQFTGIPGHVGMVETCKPDEWSGNDPERLYK